MSAVVDGSKVLRAAQDPAVPEAKPRGRQVFRIYYRLLELAELEKPSTQAEASELIDRLELALEAKRAGEAGDDIPF
jgi:hypothetical protein